MGAEHIFFAQVAMKVQAVQAELAGLPHLAFGQFRSWPESIESPKAPGNGRVELNAASVQSKHRVRAKSLGCEPAKSERDGTRIFLARGGRQRGPQVMKNRGSEIPKARLRAA